MFGGQFSGDEMKASIMALMAGEVIKLVRDDSDLTVGRLWISVANGADAERFLQNLVPVVKGMSPYNEDIDCVPENWVRRPLAGIKEGEPRVICVPKLHEPTMAWAPPPTSLAQKRIAPGE